MEMSKKLYCIWSVLFVALLLKPDFTVEGQQIYLNNKQMDCYNDRNFTDGYACNGVQTSCQAYLTFRSIPPFNSPSSIGVLLGSEPTLIADANNMSSFDTIPTDTQVLVPIHNCTCSGPYYQYNTSYKLSSDSDTYFTVANDTYQGLTTCQALMAQNPFRLSVTRISWWASTWRCHSGALARLPTKQRLASTTCSLICPAGRTTLQLLPIYSV